MPWPTSMPLSGTAVRSLRGVLALCLVAGALLAPPAADAQVPLRIIAVNDLHGHLEPGDNSVLVPHPHAPDRLVPVRSGGAAYLATRVQQLRAEVAASVFVSSGDLIGASPLVSALFRDEPTVEVMNRLGLDLGVAGNHEFDHGVAELRRMVAGGCAPEPRGATRSCADAAGRYEGMRFPLIAANVVDAAGAPLLAVLLLVDSLAAAPGHSSAGHRSGQPERRVPLIDPPEVWALGNTPFERESAWRRRLDEGLAPAQRQGLLDSVAGNWAIGSAGFARALAEKTARPARPRPRGRPAGG
ncbi:MAG: metallophosphoesterase, partial [Betaproteobacteria bacterium]